MNLAAVPPPALVKLLQLDQIAQQLSAAADRLDERVAALRHKGSGSGWNAAIESELKELLAAQPKARQRADKAMHLASGCKLYLDRLPDDAVLDVVEVEPSGDLPATRTLLAALGEERKSIINAPPSPAEMSAEVRRWVATVGEQGKPSMLLRDNVFAPRWGGGVASDPSMTPRNTLAFVCWLVPDAVAARFQQELEAQASAISRLSRDERRERLDEIEHQIEQLRFDEEALVAAAIQNGADVVRDTDTKPEAVLQVRLRSVEASSAASARSDLARTSMHQLSSGPSASVNVQPRHA
jgi:hypothetical protein